MDIVSNTNYKNRLVYVYTTLSAVHE